jgi:uncharacterized protein (UPF0212 family)
MYDVMKALEKEYVQKLEKITANCGDDFEDAHMQADEALLELLERLNMYDVTEAFKKVPRWYA